MFLAIGHQLESELMDADAAAETHIFNREFDIMGLSLGKEIG